MAKIVYSYFQKWNDGLAQYAEKVAQRSNCQMQHSGNDERKNIAGFSCVGENIWSGSSKPTPKQIVELWTGEEKDYNLGSNQCSKVCGHYTQVNAGVFQVCYNHLQYSSKNQFRFRSPG